MYRLVLDLEKLHPVDSYTHLEGGWTFIDDRGRFFQCPASFLFTLSRDNLNKSSHEIAGQASKVLERGA